MEIKIRERGMSFKHAIHGLIWAVRTQPNFQIHLTISMLVVVLSYYYRISEAEWLCIIFAITLGLVIEAINTALEVATDAITHDWRKEIMIAKDVSAAAMLIYAIGVSVMAGYIFIPKILLQLQYM